MKKLLSLLAFTLILTGCQSLCPAQGTKATKCHKKEPLLRHIVLFKFRENATETQIQKVIDAFSALPTKIKEIQSYEWGLNNSPEGLDKGFTHCFQVTFKSEADREIYLPHPDHKAFVEVLKPILADVLVVDYWTK